MTRQAIQAKLWPDCPQTLDAITPSMAAEFGISDEQAAAINRGEFERWQIERETALVRLQEALRPILKNLPTDFSATIYIGQRTAAIDIATRPVVDVGGGK